LEGETNVTESTERFPTWKRYGLLSIDGGGARGVIAAKIIQFLENKTGSDFHKLYDFAAGCSTGGLLVMSSMVKHTKGPDLTKLYQNFGSEVFPYKRWNPLKEYPVAALEKLLKGHFKQLEMKSDASSPMVSVVTKQEKDTSPYLLTNYEIPPEILGYSGWSCVRAARATSAAPTYFSPHMEGEKAYTDGGVGFNNPVLLLHEEALRILSSSFKEENSSHRIAYVVSIGTGKMPQLATTTRTNIWWSSMILSLLIGLIVGPVGFLMVYLLNMHLLGTIGTYAGIYVFLVFLVIIVLKNKPRLTNIMYYTAEQVTDAHNTHCLMEKGCRRAEIPYFRFDPILNERVRYGRYEPYG
jgi:hypothetical protein